MRAIDVARSALDLQWLMRTRRWPAARIDRYQHDALAAMLRHAVRTVPFYRDLGLAAAAAEGMHGLSAFPFLTKRTVQENEKRLLSDAYAPAELHMSRSSGSTGQPTATYFDRRAWRLVKHGLKLRRTLLHIGAPPYRVLIIGEEQSHPARRPSRLAGVTRVSVHGEVDEHLASIAHTRPTGVYGTPSWLLEIAQRAVHLGMELPRPRVVWTSAEVLTPSAREEIEHGFGCPVRDIYGSTEFKEVAVECAFGRRHLNFESTFVEVVAADAHGEGSLVVTSLVNRAMPLIRYRIGDLGALRQGPCACGSGAPWLEDLAGREADLIALPNGRRISPYVLSTLIEEQPEIARYRLLLQPSEQLEVQYQLRGGERAPDFSGLASALGAATGGRLTVSFSRVERFDRQGTPKHKVLIRSPDAA